MELCADRMHGVYRSGELLPVAGRAPGIEEVGMPRQRDQHFPMPARPALAMRFARRLPLHSATRRMRSLKETHELREGHATLEVLKHGHLARRPLASKARQREERMRIPPDHGVVSLHPRELL